MSYDLEQKRFAISEVYPGAGWKQKCMYMPAQQVCAIYYSFLKSGRFEKKKRTDKSKPTNKGFYHQISIGEYLEGLNGRDN